MTRPRPSANRQRGMAFNPILCGCVCPMLCIGVLSSSRFLHLVDWCLIVGCPVGCPVGCRSFSRRRIVGGRVIFGVAIDAEVALKGLSSCSVWNASVLPITTSSPLAIVAVQTPGLTRNVSLSYGRPFVQSQGDSCQEQPLTPASTRTPFLCPAKAPRARPLFSRRNERFPRRP